jgi:hypothetical protein
MSELIQGLVKHIHKEIDKTEWKQKVLEPIIQWIFTTIWPYVIAIICLNFFMTIAAVSLVLYIYTKHSKISFPYNS